MNSENNLIYVALGDSLTAGVGANYDRESYPYLIAQKLGFETEVILSNFSLPGLKTRDLKNEFLALAIAAKPDLVTVLIGVNDIHGNISLVEFKKNYEEILSGLKKQTSAKIYVINIPLIGADTLILPPYNLYFDWQTKKFNQTIKDLAQIYQVKYIDLYTPTVGGFKKAGVHYSPDLFHPSAVGYASWAKIIYDNFNQ
jgi:lysophospholipase L1-like esterase